MCHPSRSQERTQPFQWVGLQLQRRLQIPVLIPPSATTRGSCPQQSFGAAPLLQTQQAGLGCPSTLERPFLQQGVAGLLQPERPSGWTLTTQSTHRTRGLPFPATWAPEAGASRQDPPTAAAESAFSRGCNAPLASTTSPGALRSAARRGGPSRLTPVSLEFSTELHRAISGTAEGEPSGHPRTQAAAKRHRDEGQAAI